MMRAELDEANDENQRKDEKIRHLEEQIQEIQTSKVHVRVCVYV